MRIYDLREYIYDVVSRYFGAATVVWQNEIQPKAQLPLVRMSIRNLTVSTQGNVEKIEDEIVQYYQSSLILEINACTTAGENSHNDTVPDMYEFMKYLNSDEITDELFMNDVSIMPFGTVTDVSQMLGTSSEHRAMAEFTVNFLQLSAGAYGISHPESEKRYNPETGIWAVEKDGQQEDWKPTSTGGGSREMENAGSYEMDSAEIEMKEE